MSDEFLEIPAADDDRVVPGYPSAEPFYYTDGECWHVVYCRSRAEKQVLHQLQEKINVKLIPPTQLFLPRQMVKSRWSDRTKDVERLLFPGYLFIKLHLSNYAWHEIIMTFGVSNLLHMQTKPLIVPQKDIDVIERILESPVAFIPTSLYQEGQHVLIKRGPLQGMEGILQEIHPKSHRLVVNFPLLNRAVRTIIHIVDVEPVR